MIETFHDEGIAPGERQEPDEERYVQRAEIPEFAEALARAGGDAGLLKQMAALFLAGCPEQLSAIHEAVRRRDAEALIRSAHALKGSVANFVKGEAFEAAQRLEMMARQGDLTGSDDAWTSLLSALEQLKPGMLKLADAASDIVELEPEPQVIAR
jgi:HPt (histidine-containing phosphotransfer) domain-containing protein